MGRKIYILAGPRDIGYFRTFEAAEAELFQLTSERILTYRDERPGLVVYNTAAEPQAFFTIREAALR